MEYLIVELPYPQFLPLPQGSSWYFVEYRKEAGIEWSVHMNAGCCFFNNSGWCRGTF